MLFLNNNGHLFIVSYTFLNYDKGPHAVRSVTRYYLQFVCEQSGVHNMLSSMTATYMNREITIYWLETAITDLQGN